jgi:hypothetical protein
MIERTGILVAFYVAEDGVTFSFSPPIGSLFAHPPEFPFRVVR